VARNDLLSVSRRHSERLGELRWTRRVADEESNGVIEGIKQCEASPLHSAMIQTSPQVMTTRQVTENKNPTKKSTIVPVDARSSASPSLVATAEINIVMCVSL
jgi:hypothetical protein